MATAEKTPAALTDLEYAIQLIMTGKKDSSLLRKCKPRRRRSPRKFCASTAY